MVDFTPNPELTAHDAFPIETYEFSYPTKSYYYTSYRQNITVGGNEHIAIPITHSSIKRSLDHEVTNITIKLPISAEVAKDLLFKTSLQDVQMTYYRQHGKEADALTPDTGGRIAIWSGRILSFKVISLSVEITLYTFLSDGLRDPVPSIYYQSQCNHALYDDRCRVIMADFQRMATAVSYRNLNMVISTDLPEEWAAGGFVQKTGDKERRLITANMGNRLTLGSPFRTVADDEPLLIQAGCDHTIATCRQKFMNQPNFGGFPTVPYLNIFESGVIG